jgi:hypothetical protein
MTITTDTGTLPDVTDVTDVTDAATESSETPASLAEALMIFQSKLPIIPKTKDGQDGHRPFKYADLSAIVRKCAPLLAGLGLSVTSGTVIRGDRTILVSKLMHVSGDYEVSEIDVTASPGNMKPLGANITYARRYAYGALTGIVTDEDTDMDGTDVAEQIGADDGDEQDAWVDRMTQEQRDHLNAANNEGLPVKRIMFNLFGPNVTPANINRTQAAALCHAVDNYQA